MSCRYIHQTGNIGKGKAMEKLNGADVITGYRKTSYQFRLSLSEERTAVESSYRLGLLKF